MTINNILENLYKAKGERGQSSLFFLCFITLEMKHLTCKVQREILCNIAFACNNISFLKVHIFLTINKMII